MIQPSDASASLPPRDPELRTGRPHVRRFPVVIALVAVLATVMSFSYWWSGWFGRPATLAEIEASLASENPRDVQFGLNKAYERFNAHRAGAPPETPPPLSPELRRIGELVLRHVDAPEVGVRQIVPWTLGAAFPWRAGREALETLLLDPDANVRQNAAAALANHHSRAGVPILREMLAQANTRESWNAVYAFLSIGTRDDLPYLENARSAASSGRETIDRAIEAASQRETIEPFE